LKRCHLRWENREVNIEMLGERERERERERQRGEKERFSFFLTILGSQ
jgi:hypothetical protein